MSRRPAITHAALTLQHAPDLVRHGSKPTREPDLLPRLLASLRSFDQASVYPPHQVVIGNRAPARHVRFSSRIGADSDSSTSWSGANAPSGSPSRKSGRSPGRGSSPIRTSSNRSSSASSSYTAR